MECEHNRRKKNKTANGHLVCKSCYDSAWAECKVCDIGYNTYDVEICPLCDDDTIEIEGIETYTKEERRLLKYLISLEEQGCNFMIGKPEIKKRKKSKLTKKAGKKKK
jgi:hypothetical protein